jgi:ATP-dependent DNA ligase
MLYLDSMTFDFSLPTRSTIVPRAPDWLHEVKYDGYRLRVERDGDRVPLITRGVYNWTDRYPWIVEAALKNRQQRFALINQAGRSTGSRSRTDSTRRWIG